MFGGETGLPVRVQNRKPDFRSPTNSLRRGRNRRVDINLTKALRCFESLFDPAVMNFLLGENGQTICRDVLVDLDAKRLPYSQTSPSRR